MKWGDGTRINLRRLLRAIPDLPLLDKATYGTVGLALLYLVGHVVAWLLRG